LPFTHCFNVRPVPPPFLPTYVFSSSAASIFKEFSPPAFASRSKPSGGYVGRRFGVGRPVPSTSFPHLRSRLPRIFWALPTTTPCKGQDIVSPPLPSHPAAQSGMGGCPHDPAITFANVFHSGLPLGNVLSPGTSVK